MSSATADPVPPSSPARKHWWSRGEKGLLRAGAIAAALAAIIGLVVYFLPKDDPVDRAAILDVPLTPQPLSGYVASVTVKALPEREARSNHIDLWALFPGLRGPGALAEVTTPAQPVTAATQSHTGTTPRAMETTPPDPAETTPPDPAETTPPTSRRVPPDQLPDPEPPALLEAAPEERDEIYCAAVQQDVIARRFIIDRCDQDSPKSIPRTLDQSVDAEGNLVSPDVAAERIVDALETVRSRPYIPPPDAPPEDRGVGLLDPQGVRATVSMEFEGLSDEPLVLYWRLSQTRPDAQPLPDLWLQKTLAWQFTPGTERDAATVDVWIPLPEAVGPYVLDFLIALDDSFLTSYRTDPFD